MPRYPWFRVYNEILTERKIERIGRMTHLPRVVIRGAWMTILAMANDSPERGCLKWTDDLWITEAELRDDLEMEPDEFSPLLDAFVKMQMVTRHNGGGLSCTNFDKRQFKSDSSTPRVQAWREKQRAQETDECNVSETLLCNGPDTETEAEAEAETETEKELPAPSRHRKYSPAPDEHPAIALCEQKTRLKMNEDQRKEVIGLVGIKPDSLARWGRVVHGWLLTGWEGKNVGGMLDFYQRNEIPPGRRRTNGRLNAHQNPHGTTEPVEIATGFVEDAQLPGGPDPPGVG